MPMPKHPRRPERRPPFPRKPTSSERTAPDAAQHLEIPAGPRLQPSALLASERAGRQERSCHHQESGPAQPGDPTGHQQPSCFEDRTREVLARERPPWPRPASPRRGCPRSSSTLLAIGDFDAMNRVYDRCIDPARPPVRVCTEARPAGPDLRIEITAVAAV